MHAGATSLEAYREAMRTLTGPQNPRRTPLCSVSTTLSTGSLETVDTQYKLGLGFRVQV